MNKLLYSNEMIFSNQELVNEKQITSKKNPLTIDKLNNCKVYVYGSEGQIPHFHIESEDGKFKSCVCIYSNNYFTHGGKYTNQFSSKQRKEFNEWMSKNWNDIKDAWEEGNPNCNFPEDQKCSTKPHYENMSQYKSV